MKRCECLLIHVIVAAILRTVGKIRSVRSDGRRHERHSGISAALCPMEIARLLRQPHGAAQQLCCLLRSKAAPHKTGDGRLIACACQDICTRTQIIQMNLTHEVGTFKERLCRPERIIYGETARLQLRCQCPIKDEHILHSKPRL